MTQLTGVHPCGMGMDVLRSCYRSSMRPYADAPEVEIAGRWHWCRDGARTFPGIHLYAASVWWGHGEPVEALELGEVAPGAWYSGESDSRLTGQRYCGPLEWWRDGSPLAAEGTPEVDETGYPPCCGPTEAEEGIMRVRELDGTPDLPLVAVLTCDQSTGLTVINAGPNEARLALDPPLPATIVSSVGLSVPSPLTASGPITGAGTLVIGWGTPAVPPNHKLYLRSANGVVTWGLLDLSLGEGAVVGTLDAGHGGTGLAGWPSYQLAVGSGSGVVSLLPIGTAGHYLRSYGPGVNPGYAAISSAEVAGLGTAAAHDDSEYQPVDADLTALAGISATGLLARTAAGTAAARTLTAGSTALSVVDGDGVAGNPTVDLLRYPGQVLGSIYTATDESTASSGPVNLTTDATDSIDTGATRWVELRAQVASYNATVPAIHTLTIEIDGVDYSERRLIAVANTIELITAVVHLQVTTGAKTIRLLYGTNNGTAHYLRRSLTATALE